LTDNLSRLNEDDRKFVLEMVDLHNNGEVMNRHQILRIVDIIVPSAGDNS
jgi:hypothetical protein